MILLTLFIGIPAICWFAFNEDPKARKIFGGYYLLCGLLCLPVLPMALEGFENHPWNPEVFAIFAGYAAYMSLLILGTSKPKFNFAVIAMILSLYIYMMIHEYQDGLKYDQFRQEQSRDHSN